MDHSQIERESLEFDLVIVGAGPAGLSCACKLKQLNPELNVALLEKGSEVGAHILSGALLEPGPLQRLFPDWQQRQAPLNTPVERDSVHWLLGDQRSLKMPNWLLPSSLHNDGNYIISLAELCRWLAQQAQELGVEVLEGFPAAELLVNDGRVEGVITADMGLDSEGQPKDSYQPGYILRATQTILAEGCRGHLSKQAIALFELDKDKAPPHYGIGFKELWRVPSAQHERGLAVHTLGYPLGLQLDGGGFCYHLDEDLDFGRVGRELELQQPVVEPLRGVQPLQKAQAYQLLFGGRRALGLWCPRFAEGWYLFVAEAAIPGRAAHRRRRWFSQPRQNQR